MAEVASVDCEANERKGKAQEMGKVVMDQLEQKWPWQVRAAGRVFARFGPPDVLKLLSVERERTDEAETKCEGMLDGSCVAVEKVDVS